MDNKLKSKTRLAIIQYIFLVLSRKNDDLEKIKEEFDNYFYGKTFSNISDKNEFKINYNKNLEKYDGFVALGCIIRGETYHFELIANEVSRKIMDLSIQSNKPIGFGIITCENMQQAKARSNKIETWSNIKESFGKAKKTNKGIEAAVAVVNNIHW